MPHASAPVAIVADDERLMREQIVTQLRQAWPELVIAGEASNGREAVALAHSLDADIAFLDIRMAALCGASSSAFRIVTTASSYRRATVNVRPRK